MALTAQQIETRRSHIGGSDAKTVLEGDAAAWKALYDEKVDGVQPVFPPARQLLMDMGQAIEPLCLDQFNRKVPLAPEPMPRHFIWKDDPILAFTPDGITEQDSRGSVQVPHRRPDHPRAGRDLQGPADPRDDLLATRAACGWP